ncbi:MAG: hypothetical protein IJY04_09090 [Clostridia bacterium]|nr:hypothetical protein [Clostridia bacterium]
MRQFKLTVSSPSGNVFDGEAVMLTVRGADGELAVMAGHVPLVTPVLACDCKIETADGTERFGHTNGGILTVDHDAVTLLSGSFKFKE